MWLIIGYGNRLRGDDGAGPVTADQLQRILPSGSVRVHIAHQLTPELSLEIAAAEIEQILFIDAQRNQKEHYKLQPLSTTTIGSCGHQLTPVTLLTLAAQLYDQPRPGWLLSIAGYDFSFREQLSPQTSLAIEAALSKLTSFVQHPRA